MHPTRLKIKRRLDQGKSVMQIAYELKLTPAAVSKHKKAIEADEARKAQAPA
jgi:DNA-binding NarL/FixJ family response regulator